MIEVLVAANGEGFREFYENDATYGHPAVDRAMAAAEPLAEHLRGAVSLLDDLADVLADVSHGVVPADGSVVRDILLRATRHVSGER